MGSLGSGAIQQPICDEQSEYHCRGNRDIVHQNSARLLCIDRPDTDPMRQRHDKQLRNRFPDRASVPGRRWVCAHASVAHHRVPARHSGPARSHPAGRPPARLQRRDRRPSPIQDPRSAFVDLSSMGQRHHDNEQYIVLDRVDDAIVTDANPQTWPTLRKCRHRHSATRLDPTPATRRLIPDG